MADDTRQVVVTHAHGNYQRGDLVTDPALVEALLRDHPAKVAAIGPEKQT